MTEKEYRWKQNKIGMMSASSIDKLMSASGKWTVGNISYLYEIQYQRKNKIPSDTVTARSMTIGVENEPYVIAWLRENTDWDVLHCDVDFTEKIFATIPEIGYGVSPDGYVMQYTIERMYNEVHEITNHDELIPDIKALAEIKCVVGTKKYWLFSDTVPFEKKRIDVFTEHRGQMAGQLIRFPNVNTIYLVKYLPQSDDNEFDMDSPLDPRRGLIFEYSRKEFGSYLDDVYNRVVQADEYLKLGLDLSDINDYYKTNKNGTKKSKNSEL